MKVREILTESVLKESVHIDHPEDSIFSGSTKATAAVNTLKQLAAGKEPTSIKWDGFPALVFGRNVDGQLVVADKHMFTKKDGSGRVTSPGAFQQYDQARGADRSDLYGKIAVLWQALEQSVPKQMRGYFMGDLLYAGRLQPQGGMYVFKPNTVTYRVKANSGAGQHIASSVGGIAVHTFIPDVGATDQPLQGLGGLPESGPIWFVTGAMPVPQIQADTKEIDTVLAAIGKLGTQVDTMLGGLSSNKARAVASAFGPYITAKIAQGNFNHMLEGFYQYLPTRLPATVASRVLGDKQDGYLYSPEGRAGLQAMFEIWVMIYNLKLNMKKQIDSQQASGDVQASIGSNGGHEGYVTGGGTNKLKLIDRLNFSRANFAKNG